MRIIVQRDVGDDRVSDDKETLEVVAALQELEALLYAEGVRRGSLHIEYLEHEQRESVGRWVVFVTFGVRRVE